MCIQNPPRYSPRPVSVSSNSNILTKASVEETVQNAITSSEVLDQIADRVAMRISSKIEKMVGELSSKMHSSGKQVVAGSSSVQASGSSTICNSGLYYEYRTVTQAEIASVMAALPGVTWKRCPKNHLYAVGECGNAV
ncbi:hypothetical protein IWW50_006489, partial [Coemansia erecta]